MDWPRATFLLTMSLHYLMNQAARVNCWLVAILFCAPFSESEQLGSHDRTTTLTSKPVSPVIDICTPTVAARHADQRATAQELAKWRGILSHMAVVTAFELTENQVREGVPVSVVAQLTGELGLSTPTLLAWLQVAPRTWARRKQTGRFDMLESDRLARLGRLVRRARNVLGGSEEAKAWMSKPNRALQDRTPFDVAGTEVGAESVFDLLGRLEHGVFS